LIGLINKDEIIARVWIAYEQLEKCHTKICQTIPNRDDNSFILDYLRIAMNDILNVQVKLGAIKREEDL
jgi:hypothetical protein